MDDAEVPLDDLDEAADVGNTENQDCPFALTRRSYQASIGWVLRP